MSADSGSDKDLECRDLVRRFGAFVAVNDVGFAVSAGEFFSILGPSGCGKTTLLRMIAGFDEPDGGDILIGGSSVLGVPPNRRAANMVFQHLALFPMMNVAENVGYGLRRRRQPAAEVSRRVGDALARVGLAEAGGKRIDQLSGGQQQRVAIARCLVLEPRVLLLDEPLGALDLKLREHMKVELKMLQQQVGTTFVYITHDQSEALVMSDYVAVMNRGRFEQVGRPEDLYHRPASAFVAGFVGEANRWPARVEGIEGSRLLLRTEGDMRISAERPAAGRLAEGDRVEVFVRPEQIALQRGDRDGDPEGANRVDGRVVEILFNGAASRVLIRVGAVEVTAGLPQAGALGALLRGDPVSLRWPAGQTRVFPCPTDPD